ncbi:hypothetical protein HPB49_019897 [Dermacentor silvarum]|uniref:Uncharacterized protein n=1 Tax=Dermacentor silvarum TaxID=543639 RepID=A0ACB8CT18_DERSI|nr:hypothetical protein HPB49_019897 [Dermacentor silvarum]
MTRRRRTRDSAADLSGSAMGLLQPSGSLLTEAVRDTLRLRATGNQNLCGRCGGQSLAYTSGEVVTRNYATLAAQEQMERRASRRNVEDANEGEIFQEVRLDDNGNMEEAPITGKLLSGDDKSAGGALRIPTAVMYSFGVVMLLSSCVILVSLFYIMSAGRPFSPRDKPLPKPEPTMTIKLRVADLPESFLGALRQRGGGPGAANGSAAATATATDQSRGHGDGRRHSPAAPPHVAGSASDHRTPLERPGEPRMLAQMYGDNAVADEGYANIGRVGPGSRADVKEIVVIQSPICSQVWESQRVDCHPESSPSHESCR